MFQEPREATRNYPKTIALWIIQRFSMESKGKCQVDITNVSNKWLNPLFALFEAPFSPLLIDIIPRI